MLILLNQGENDYIILEVFLMDYKNVAACVSKRSNETDIMGYSGVLEYFVCNTGRILILNRTVHTNTQEKVSGN